MSSVVYTAHMDATTAPARTAADWSAIYAAYNAETARRNAEWDARSAAGELSYESGERHNIDNP